MDIVNARGTATSTITTLSKCRTDNAFDDVWLLSEQISRTLKTLLEHTLYDFKESTVPRNSTMEVKQYHKVNTYFAGIDKVVGELSQRFATNDQDVLCALATVVRGSVATNSHYYLISDRYGVDADILQAERNIFYCSHSEMKYVSEVVSATSEDVLHVFAKVAKLLVSIPATSCSAERSFSGLRRMKIYIPSKHDGRGSAERSLYSQHIMQHMLWNVSKNINAVIDIFGKEGKGDSISFESPQHNDSIDVFGNTF